MARPLQHITGKTAPKYLGNITFPYFLKCLWVKQVYEIEISLSVEAIIVTKPKYPAAYIQRICYAKRFALVPYLIISPHGALCIQSNWNLFRTCIPL